ncbi:hypothetical protein LDENG_00180090 [Lucifuga dentata]|nr:hypothetical protein LDENG_00180090 [Lucifuga dentata]
MDKNNNRKPEPLKPPRSSVRSGAETKQVRRVQTRKIPYRVGYNWNKGGRLKELRIRHLARKFLKIWMQKTFGRIHPHKARCHHRTVTLLRAFKGWTDEWWTSRREWSLTMRAECHYKYYLYNWTFHSWLKFMSVQREKKKKVQNAQSFADRQGMRQVWDRWEIFIEMRRMKGRMLESALQQKRMVTLRSAWILWQTKLQQHRDFLALEDKALKHQEQTLQRRVWLQWKESHRAACSQKEKESKASFHFILGLKRKTFHQWISYVSCHQAKKKPQALAVRACHLSLLRTCWSKWCSALYHKRTEEDRLEAAGHLATQSTQRRALQQWKAYVKLCREKAKRNQMATQHHHQYLLHVGLQGLSLNVSWNKAHQLNKNVAAQHHHQTMTSKYWKLWQERVEEAEDKNFQPQLEMALRTNRTTMVSSCFHHWREKLAEKRHMQELEHRADIWFAECKLPWCFNSWIEFTLQRRLHKQRTEKAKVYNQQRQYSWVFYTWWGELEKHKEQMLSERMAVLHEERCHLQRAWDHWRQRTQQQINEVEKQRASDRLYLHTLLHNTIKQWKDNSAEIRDRRNREEQANHQGDLCCMRWTLDKWKKFVQSQRVKKNKLEQMQHYHEVQLLKRVFGTWKKHHLQMCQVYGHAEQLYRRQTRCFLRSVLTAWRENTVLLAEFRIMEQKAENHSQLVLQLKVFLAWRGATAHAVSKRHQQGEALMRAQSCINQVRLQASFRRWRKQTRMAQRERMGTEKARQHHDSKVLSQALKAWNKHHYQCQKNKIMKRQGNMLLRLKMYQTYFERWKMKVQHRRKETRQTERALWHWSLSLQAKVLYGWRLWVTEQRAQREHIARAAQLYRDQLLREGVTCILTYAAHMNSLTSSLQQPSREQRSHHLQRVVRRCAMRWKQQALGKLDRVQEVRGLLPKKSVTFSLPASSNSVLHRVSQSDSVEQRAEDGALSELFLKRKGRPQPRRCEELLASPIKELRKNSTQRQSSVTSTETKSHVTAQQQSHLHTDPHPLELRSVPHKGQAAASSCLQPVTGSFISVPQSFLVSATGHSDPHISAMDSPCGSQETHLLLPPSAFMATSTTYMLGKTSNSNLLLPLHQFVPPPIKQQSSSCSGTIATPWYPEVHMRAFSEEDVEADQASQLMRELLSIQLDMERFQQERKQLRAWQNLKEVLQTWLQTSGKDEEVEKNAVCQELKELEERIDRLSTELSRQKPTMLRHAERIQHLQTVLHTSGVTFLCRQTEEIERITRCLQQDRKTANKSPPSCFLDSSSSV